MDNLSAKSSFTWLDWIVMILYMLGVLVIPIFFFWQSKKDKKFNSSKYLTAKNMRVPAIVVALSIWATALSSLTFLGTPGLAFKTGWMWIAGQITILAITPYLTKIIIPFYRRIKGSTSYTYLQQRFNYAVRFIGSISFILFHIFRMGIVLYIPALTITLFVDINIYLLLFIVSIIVIISTFLGGFKGVLYTDAVQGFVLMLGIFLVIIFGLAKTNWSASTTKLHILFSKDQWKISLTSGGIFFIFISNYISTMFSYSASQDIVQRYKTGKTISTTYKSIYINVILVAITILFFYGAGSILYTYYSSHGFEVDAKNAIDQIVGRDKAANNLLLSNFIVKVLPMGISGLVVSAVFAASQSTVSSSLNSLVTTFINDIVIVFYNKIKEKSKLFLSYILTIVFGFLGFLVTILLAATKQQNLIDYFLGIVGLLGAPLAAVFLLGVVTKKTNAIGALTGLIISFLITLPIWILVKITKTIKFDTIYLGVISFVVVLLIGYLISIVIEKLKLSKEKDLTNLTMHTRTDEFKKLVKLEKEALKLELKTKKNNEFKKLFDEKMVEIKRLEEIVENQT
ncbi:sodium:solute symporter family transporter [Mesomycoplasma neurolyticum]|uniref:Na(+)/glucose symporter n=1 Tax=Mesomycoplasma neurolyticum TaxID=2120 RepID=A0A449A566_9BACT|nr:sodium/solute symporter [Mesomycoplasma neurolyticum]VEU59293.1 Na(+)/glucose symporter [Mesomycoplasma neurolyticum]